MQMISPSSISAMGPPTAASGETCPIDAPRDAPENLPSVINATLEPRPIPAMAEVGFNISRIPGPPLGPSYRMTTTSPATILPPLIAAIASSSHSNTRAGPSCTIISSTTAERFTTLPSGARFPLSTARPPVLLYGFSTVLMTSVFLLTASLMFSPSVLPVTVMQSVCKRPMSASSFMTAWTPPASFRSSIYVGPAGAR